MSARCGRTQRGAMRPVCDTKGGPIPAPVTCVATASHPLFVDPLVVHWWEASGSGQSEVPRRGPRRRRVLQAPADAILPSRTPRIADARCADTASPRGPHAALVCR